MRSFYEFLLGLIFLAAGMGCLFWIALYLVNDEGAKVEEGYLLFNLESGELILSSPCPEGQVARLDDLNITAPTYQGTEYAEGRIYLTPSQRLLVVRTIGWKPPLLCGPAYQ